jgi:hypothetical protein
MGSSFPLEEVLWGVAVVMVVVVAAKKYEGYRALNEKEKSISDPIINQIDLTLKEVYDTFYKEAVGYHLFMASNKYEFTSGQETKLFSEFPSAFAEPIIDWGKTFEFVAEKIHLRDQQIKAFIESLSADYCKNEEFIPNCFERLAIEKAKLKADDIVKNILSCGNE